MAMKPDSLAVEFCALPLAFASSFGRHGRTVYDGWTGANARSFLQQPRRSRQGIPPKVGRWLSNDPIGISGGLNQYTAFGNNPVMVVDPWGERIELRAWMAKAWLALRLVIEASNQAQAPARVLLEKKKVAIVAVTKASLTMIAGLIMIPTEAQAGESDFLFNQRMAMLGYEQNCDGEWDAPWDIQLEVYRTLYTN